MTPSPDVVVIGAGIIGAATAYELTLRGLAVTVVDRGPVAGGTTGAGEGNILVSDKEPGPELDLALLSQRLWLELGDVLPDMELDCKGGLVVALDAGPLDGLHRLAADQRDVGIDAQILQPDDLSSHEPHLSRDIAGGVLYPQDTQVQPMLATARLLHAACGRGAKVLTYQEVIGIERTATGAVAAVATAAGRIPCSHVVNAAGTWGGDVAALAGAPIPILPRRGFILVTEPVGQLVRHKVYSADYVANVASDTAELQTSAVIEGTRAGPILIGASRERVMFDRQVSFDVLGRLAAQAIRLFPVLAGVRVQRSYGGFRPYCPDHVPVIGPDARVAGLLHACGHEGAGVGLAPATARVLAEVILGHPTSVDLRAFDPMRFAMEAA